jgi:hypothetical protein
MSRSRSGGFGDILESNFIGEFLNFEAFQIDTIYRHPPQKLLFYEFDSFRCLVT